MVRQKLLRFKHKSIALLGFGYWGKIIYNILSKKEYKLHFVITSKSRLLESMGIDHIPVTNFEKSPLIKSTTHLFVISGPTFHHIALKKIMHDAEAKKNLKVWIEKPVFIDYSRRKDEYKYLQDVFVDYIYTNQNADKNIIGDIKKKEHDIIDIGIFSKNKYARDYSPIFDFAPHFLCIMHIITDQLKLAGITDVKVEKIRNLEISSNEYVNRRNTFCYYFKTKCLITDIVFNVYIGSNLKRESFIACKNKKHPHKVIKSYKLKDVFELPVNNNIDMFLADKEAFDKLPNTLNYNTEFHCLVYDFSSHLQKIIQSLEE